MFNNNMLYAALTGNENEISSVDTVKIVSLWVFVCLLYMYIYI